MECAFLKKTLLTALFLIFMSLSLSVFSSCKDSASSTDLVAITEVNAFVSREEAARGMKKTLETTIRVTMPHQQHEKAGVACVTCHHKKSNDERTKTCSYCHKGLKGAQHLHTFCIGCHRNKNDGPVRCNECHMEKAEKQEYRDIEKMYAKSFAFDKKQHGIHADQKIQCNVCHHDAGKEAPTKQCSECHVGKSKMKILHYFCKECHKQKGGPVKCRECHAGVNAGYQEGNAVILLDKTGHRLPQIRFNHKAHIEEYNTECIDCHHKGSMKKCSACHTRKDMDAVINLKSAYHQQCQGCHRQTSGPKGCYRCHRLQK